MELASCHPSIASKFEVASTFLEDFHAAAHIPPNFFTGALRHSARG
jgi:hypothetical protein